MRVFQRSFGQQVDGPPGPCLQCLTQSEIGVGVIRRWERFESDEKVEIAARGIETTAGGRGPKNIKPADTKAAASRLQLTV